MSRLRPWLALLAVLPALLVARPSASPAQPQRAAPETARVLTGARTVPCTDVLLVGASGNGETPASAGSAGPTVDRFAAAYRAAALAGGRSVRTVTFVAPTAPAGSLAVAGAKDRPAVRAVDPDRLSTWRSGIDERAARITSALRDAAVACPQQQLVVAGYAQGAMAAHRALRALRADPAVLTRVVAAVLVSDGDRVADTRATHLLGLPGAPRTGSGLVGRASGGRADLPATGSDLQVWQVCTRGDVVCDLRGTPFREAAATTAAYSADAAELLAGVADRVWRRTLRWARPVPMQGPVLAQVGTQLEAPLPVSVRPRDRADVRWSGAKGLPPGVTLTPQGVLTGVPSRSGDFSVTFSVSNTATTTFQLPVSGRVQVTVQDPPAVSGTVTSGGGQSCAVRTDGTAWCWGDNGFGQLGDGTRTAARQPVQVAKGTRWASISSSGSSTCAVDADGQASCWGLNRWGQLGDGTRTLRVRPSVVTDAGPWASVSAGWYHSCGIKVDGTAWCWGANDQGQLGDGTRTARSTPVRVAGGGTWTQITVGGWHTCGLRPDGSAWCWGRNLQGELGVAGSISQPRPVRVGAASDWLRVDASWTHTCGIRRGGRGWCWGANDHGQLGDGSRDSRWFPTPVAGEHAFATVSVGLSSTCAVDRTGQLWCWGDNGYGQLGDGTTKEATVATAATTAESLAGERWRDVDLGWLHGCGILTSGRVACWGNNETGQLGDGSITDRPQAAVTDVRTRS